VKRKTFYGKLDALGFKTYSAYLRSAHWRQVKEAYRESDRDQACYCCGDPDDVHLHHKTYERIGHEELDDLVALCPRCHHLVHVLEARGQLTIDLEGLLDETRAHRYAIEQRPIIDRARADYHDTHEPSVLYTLPQRVAIVEARATDGDREANRALFVIRQVLEKYERRAGPIPSAPSL